jgi:hypothetical protein
MSSKLPHRPTRDATKSEPSAQGTENHSPGHFTPAEYIVRNQDGQDLQIAAARWQLLKAIEKVVPTFLQQLRDQVYPEYARLAGESPDYWVNGWEFATWKLLSDRDNRLTPHLISWAQEFNVQRED